MLSNTHYNTKRDISIAIGKTRTACTVFFIAIGAPGRLGMGRSGEG